MLQLVLLTGLLVEYNFHEHVASDIGIGQQFLPAENYPVQENLNEVARWTDNNLMRLNEAKCRYMIYVPVPTVTLPQG